jgi:hypothetical protein
MYVLWFIINLNAVAQIYTYFLGALEKGGVGALELVAMDMKARYLFFCQISIVMYMKSPSVMGNMSQPCFL